MSNREELVKIKYADLINNAITHINDLLDYQDGIKDDKKVLFYYKDKYTNINLVENKYMLNFIESSIYWRVPQIAQAFRMLAKNPLIEKNEQYIFCNIIINSIYERLINYLDEADFKYNEVYIDTRVYAKTSFLNYLGFINDINIQPNSVYARQLSKIMTLFYEQF